ncbi:hypothetical protein C8T65DRAFT_735641 [Cerioporus squamosus]|nr:hypothetical protein C8T65DRAFT_735641 [Cerioporus squamosus]
MALDATLTDPESELGSPSESVPMQLEHLIIECKSILSPQSNSESESESESYCQWSLSGMMHILSLLASNAVTTETFNPSYSTAKPAVQDLRLSWETPNKSLSEKVLNALSVTLARDCLESVEMMYDSKLALRALSTLLAAGAPRRERYELGG